MTAVRSAGIGIDQAFAKGVGDEFGGVVRPGFAHNAGAVAVDGFDADAQGLPDFAVGASGHDLAQDLPLAVGQRFKIARLLKQPGKPGTDNASAFEDTRDGADDLAHIIAFAEYAIGPDLNQFCNLAARLDSGEDDYAGFRRPAPRFKQNFGPTCMRHRHIKHKKTRSVLSDGNDGLDPVFDPLDNLDLLTLERVFVFERGGQRIANDRVVIRDNSAANLTKCGHSSQNARSPICLSPFGRCTVYKSAKGERAF